MGAGGSGVSIGGGTVGGSEVALGGGEVGGGMVGGTSVGVAATGGAEGTLTVSTAAGEAVVPPQPVRETAMIVTTEAKVRQATRG